MTREETWAVGDKVIANGYPGVISEVYIPPQHKGFSAYGMYNVRIARGETCISGDRLIRRDA